MSQTVITQAFEALKAQEAANCGVVTLDEFVFASVPNLNITDPIDRSEGLPPAEQIVHRQAVSKTGMVNSNAVVYSVVLGADVGDFEFNWVGLLNKASGVVAMIVHAPSQKKIKTASGQQGNVLTRSFLMEYNGASQQTQIITPADTWQIDFTARLNGVDERVRIENIDSYGAASFLGDGFFVSKNGAKYDVKKGAAYVAGLRAELLYDQAMTVSTLPSKIWVDVCWQGTMTSVWASQTKLTVAENLVDYTENDTRHHVFAIAEIQADGTIKDLRPVSTPHALMSINPEADTLPYFDGDAKARLSPLSAFVREMLSKRGESEVLEFLGLQKDGDSGVSDERVSVKQPFAGAIFESQHELNAKRIDALNSGARGDAVTDDTAAFDILEAQSDFTVIDGLWRTYLVTSYPTRHRYINTTFLIAGKTARGNGYFEGRTGGTNVIVGDGAAPDLPANPTTSSGTANVVMGEDAMKHAKNVRSSMAFGLRAMWTAVSGKYNMAFGLESLFYVDADGTTYGGTRNVMFGDNTGRFITTGYQNCGFGRNNSQGITTGNNNASFGTNAMAGRGSLKFKDSQYIQNMTPITVERCTAVGSNALYYGAGDGSSGTGERALSNAKKDALNCSAYGASALLSLGANTSIDGRVSVDDGRTGSYAMNASGITFTLAAHGLATGFGIIVSLTTGVPYQDYQYYSVTVVDDNTFTVSEPEGIITSGSFTLISYSTLASQVASISNSAFGAGAMYNVMYGSENLAIGVNAMPVNTGGNQNVSVGNLTMSYAVNSSQCVAIGYRALRTMMDGSQAVSMTNCIGIGENARVSGNNQMQLGNAAITVYTQTAIQTRSDERDKTDKREIPGDLAVAFVRGLVPHFYKYDFRDDYIEEYDEEIGVDARGNAIVEHRTRMLEKDGSKKRIRDHAGFIAQQVKELMDKLGIDFGMYQDHLVNGGCDVKTLAYEQSIPFLTKAVDVAFSEIDGLRAELAELKKSVQKTA